MKVVCDTGPLAAAANQRDRAHGLAAGLVQELGRDLLVPAPVIVETDQLLRARVGSESARRFLMAMVSGEHVPVFLSPRLLERAVEIDDRHADLDLGVTDAAVMAIAERGNYPILTFDFEDFRAAAPSKGYWRLVVDEARFRDATEG